MLAGDSEMLLHDGLEKSGETVEGIKRGGWSTSYAE
jgi:hypothetical protein